MKDVGEPEISKSEFDELLGTLGGGEEIDKEMFVHWILAKTKEIGEEQMYTWLEKWGYDH